jgi:hypothetical protein
MAAFLALLTGGVNKEPSSLVFFKAGFLGAAGFLAAAGLLGAAGFLAAAGFLGAAGFLATAGFLAAAGFLADFCVAAGDPAGAPGNSSSLRIFGIGTSY